jgi:hypothetical protein
MHKGFWGVKRQGKRPLEIPGCMRKDDIKMELKDIGWGYGLD